MNEYIYKQIRSSSITGWLCSVILITKLLIRFRSQTKKLPIGAISLLVFCTLGPAKHGYAATYSNLPISEVCKPGLIGCKYVEDFHVIRQGPLVMALPAMIFTCDQGLSQTVSYSEANGSTFGVGISAELSGMIGGATRSITAGLGFEANWSWTRTTTNAGSIMITGLPWKASWAEFSPDLYVSYGRFSSFDTWGRTYESVQTVSSTPILRNGLPVGRVVARSRDSTDQEKYDYCGGGSYGRPFQYLSLHNNHNLNLCIDANPIASGSYIRMWECNNGQHQSFVHNNNGELKMGDKCLDAEWGGTAPGTLVFLWDCNGDPNQKWKVTSGGTIINQKSGLCLDMDWGSDQYYATGTNGTRVHLNHCWGYPWQNWTDNSTNWDSYTF